MTCLLLGVGMLLFGHFEGPGVYGPYSVFILLGNFLVSLGTTISAVSGGVHNPYAVIAIFGGIFLVLIATNFYDVAGLRGWV
jgi:hypothetical protein